MGGRRSHRRVVVVGVVGEGMSYVVVGGSHWLGWEAVECRDSSGDRVVIAVVANRHATYISLCVWTWIKWREEDIPEVGTDVSCRSNAGLGDGGYCTPAAMAHRAVVVVDRNLSCCSLACSLAVVKIVAVVAELGRSWHGMEAVGLDCLEDEEGNSALRRSTRLLPYLIL